MEDYTGQTDRYGVIYRKFVVHRSSKTYLGKFLQDLLTVSGCITQMYQIGAYKKEWQRYTSSFYLLRFPSVDHLNRFHELGYQTTAYEKINLSSNMLPDVVEK